MLHHLTDGEMFYFWLTARCPVHATSHKGGGQRSKVDWALTLTRLNGCSLSVNCSKGHGAVVVSIAALSRLVRTGPCFIRPTHALFLLGSAVGSLSEAPLPCTVVFPPSGLSFVHHSRLKEFKRRNAVTVAHLLQNTCRVHRIFEDGAVIPLLATNYGTRSVD